MFLKKEVNKMKRIFLGLVMFFSTLSFGGQGYTVDEYSIGPVTIQQAKQAIIQWSGRSNLDIEEVPRKEIDPSMVVPLGRCAAGGLKGVHPTAHGAYGTYYAFGVLDPNPDKKYLGGIYVDSYTGKVVKVEKTPVEIRKGTIANMIAPQQAINLARQITASYFPDIPVYSFEGVETDPAITSEGSWKEYADSILVQLYNCATSQAGKVKLDIQSVWVTIDSWTGELEEIEVGYEPLEINPVPTLTVEEAIQSLISYFYGLGADYVEIIDVSDKWHVYRESPNGPQRLYIEIDCWVSEPEGSNILPANFWTCAVDGHTGEIVWGDFSIPPLPASLSTKGGKPATPSLFFDGRVTKIKPLLKEGKIYLNIVDLGKIGFKVEKVEGGYTISYKDEKVTLSDKEFLRRGSDVFLEGERLSNLKGVMTRYDEEGKRLNIWIMNEKAYKRGLEDRQKLGKGKSTPTAPHLEKKGSKKTSGAVLGGTLSLSVIGYALWKLLKILG